MIPQKYPTHDKSHFYKYASAETAKLILKSKKYRYSSPLLFNDPFDVQTELLFDFDKDTFPDLVFDEIENIILDRKQVDLNVEDEWGLAITLLKNKAQKEGYNRNYTKAVIVPFIKALTQIMDKLRADYNKMWRDDLQRLRVFSVSEVNDNILMWSHYSDNHEGVVFKLKVIPEIDNPLCVARKIIYKKKLPTFFTAREWIDEIISVKELNNEKLSLEYAYYKSDFWAYEREWRIWDLLPERDNKLYSDYKVYTEEIVAVYFGCKISKNNKIEIIKLAKEVNPSVVFFQGEKSKEDYGIVFNAIGI